MEGVEVEGLIDILILAFRLAVGCAVVAWVIQGMDLTVFTPRDKRVFLNGIQVFCSTDKKKGKEGRNVENKRKGVYKRISQINKRSVKGNYIKRRENKENRN